MFARTQFLTFHGIGTPAVAIASDEQRFFVSAETYRRTIGRLGELEQRHSVRLEVTFDDGNLSDFTIGLPALVEAGRSGRFFVLAGRIGTKGYLSADQMRQILAAGSTIGSHGHDHVDWRKLDAVGIQHELVDARRRIEDTVGTAVTEAAIPFGAFDRRVLHLLRTAGYSRIYTSTSGLAYDQAWFCPRWSVTDKFDPDRDVEPRLAMKQKIRSSLYAMARRVRYRI
ncbi:polysaccharide deacetylase family protein [Roseibium sediminicola]|uniref:Chitooligosaccharide deacetylase n=1 Tax=Roseibium sediminicola TaxID=2933272 RepID=A0ABT0H1L5_9HYPH|nr:polysaccharide deacetylase family protein [Roseibium sp. CAU 1639]MCK7615561.1 polysaccharide deacetylase family protein [Roseibium sp. CAU 1639]